MAIAAELITLLGFKIEGEQNLKRYGKLQDTAERDAIARGKRIGVGVAGGLTALAVGGKKAYDAWLPVELRLARIALNAGKSTKEVPGMFGKISELAQRFGTTTETVTTGLENLVAKGADVEEAFATLPDILNTVQGFGVQIDDAADTAYKLRDAFKLTKDEAKQLSDVLGASGQSGQFEYNDFAKYAPSLGNLYAATTGQTGIRGVKELSALGQMIREDTATSGEAATLIENLLSKVYSEQTLKGFKDFGVDFKAEMQKQIADGKDWAAALADILNSTLKGDAGRTQEIFGADMQVNAAARSLMTSRDRYEHFRKAVDDPSVAGTAARNVNEVLDLQITKVERLTERWNSLWVTLGAKISGPVGGALDAAINQINAPAEFEAGLKARGYGGISGQLAQFFMGPSTQKAIIAEGRAILAGRPLPKVAAGGDSMVARSYSGGAKSVGSVIPGGRDFTVGTIQSMLEGMNSHLAQMTANAVGDAKITDARVDARDMSVKPNVIINQTVTQATQAPGAAAAATGNAVGNAITAQQGRLSAEPSE